MSEQASMTAARLVAFGQPAQIHQVPIPTAGPGGAVIKVLACGACHSDLHMLDRPGLFDWELPFTLGHEVAGEVVELGADARSVGIGIGDRVAVYGVWGCSDCAECRAGQTHLCSTYRPGDRLGGGLGYDGGMAEYQAIPNVAMLVPLGALDPVTAAPLTDAGLTPYHAIRRALPVLRPQPRCLVIGVGGLGHLAVQLLRRFFPESHIAATDTSVDRTRGAVGLGADVGYSPDDIPRRRSFDLVLDTVGTDDTIALSASVTAREGYIAILGRGGRLEVGLRDLASDVHVVATFWGSRDDLQGLVRMAEDDPLHVDTKVYPLERMAEAYDDLHAGRLSGRAVIVPGR